VAVNILGKTKAGRRFIGFMRAFNQHSDYDALVRESVAETALAATDAATWAAELQRIYTATGGVRVMQVIATDEYRVVVLMQTQSDGTLQIIDMGVSEDYPHHITHLSHRINDARAE
jgi:hypothetical protein